NTRTASSCRSGGQSKTRSRTSFTSSFVILRPTEILFAEWKRADALAGDLEDRLGHSRRDLRARLLADAGDPFVVGLEKFNVDLRRIVRHPGNRVRIEIALDRAPFLDGVFLPHGVAGRPGEWALDSFA